MIRSISHQQKQFCIINERYDHYWRARIKSSKMSRNGQEILYEGWLTKSPPTKRIWRGRWRRRWFTLHPGELPGQCLLSYYTDRNSRKLKGSIDMDQCEQVDTGLKFEDKKYKFDHMFDIKTPSRTYYLAADTDSEMKTWVKWICNVCGLKATSDEEDCKFEEEAVSIEATTESPPVSPVSTSPYIPISECITGKVPVLPNQPIKDFHALLQQNVISSYFRSRNHTNDTYGYAPPTYLNCDPKFYDTPRKLLPSNKGNNLNKSQEEPSYCNFDKNINSSPLQSPTNSESVFTDDDWSHNTSHSEQNIRNTRPSNSSNDIETTSFKMRKLSLDASKQPVAPPRPPKPSHIINPGVSYHNLQSNRTSKDDISKLGNHSKTNSTSEDMQGFLTDEMYDFPRSHNVENVESRTTLSRRHCYNNAAPSSVDGQIFTYDNPSPKPSTSSTQVFRYGDEILDEPASPVSQGSSTAQYSNLPSPLLPDTQLMPPPRVNRGLKPKRKHSDSLSISSNTEPASPQLAPSIDRKLKPFNTICGSMPVQKSFESDDDNMSRKFRAAPSPTPPSLGRSQESILADNDNEQIYVYPVALTDENKILEYLDLDLENKSNNTKQSKKLNVEPLRSPGAITVYKEVDFMKTEAFNITRNNLEKERNKTVPTLKK